MDERGVVVSETCVGEPAEVGEKGSRTAAATSAASSARRGLPVSSQK